MPQPTKSQVHVDAVLTNISVAYLQNADSFIADKVFPVVPVDKKSNKYFVYPFLMIRRPPSSPLAPYTALVRSGYSLSTDSYSCDVWTFHKDVDDQTVAITIGTDTTHYVVGTALMDASANDITTVVINCASAGRGA